MAEILTSKKGLFVRTSNSTNNFNLNTYSKSLFGKIIFFLKDFFFAMFCNK